MLSLKYGFATYIVAGYLCAIVMYRFSLFSRHSSHSMVADVSTEGINGSFIWKQRGGNEFARHNARN